MKTLFSIAITAVALAYAWAPSATQAATPAKMAVPTCTASLAVQAQSDESVNHNAWTSIAEVYATPDTKGTMLTLGAADAVLSFAGASQLTQVGGAHAPPTQPAAVIAAKGTYAQGERTDGYGTTIAWHAGAYGTTSTQ